MQLSYRGTKPFQDRPSRNWVRARTNLRLVKLLTTCVATSLCLFLAGAKSKSRKTPDFADVTAAVEQYFASIAGYQQGDLISKSQIVSALKQVKDAGFKAPKANEVIKLGLPDNSFLVREFSTPAGRQFIRKTGRYAGGYSHLDRLSSTPEGQRTIRQLMREKGGDKFIEYLATTKSGHNLGGMLAGARQGVDLNKPTGRIYTADELLAVLQKSFVPHAP